MSSLKPSSKVNLKTIDLQSLLREDDHECTKLLQAVTKEGFFYLDFRQMDQGAAMLDTVERMFKFQEDLFNLPEDQKLKYDVDRLSFMKLNGYKPKGRNFGGIGGKKDGFESWADGVMALGDEPFSRPPKMDEDMSLLGEYFSKMLTATGAIHSSLSRALKLPVGQRFEDFHRPDQPSPCLLRLLKYHPQPIDERGPPQTPHTDLGSLTILFTKQPGLQVLPKGAQEWTFVEPKVGHAIVNIGDGMSMMTNGLFQSCLHRVSPLPDQCMQTRYSMAYLQRAEAHTRLTGIESPDIPAADNSNEIMTSGEWLNKKFGMLRAKTHVNDETWILTGRKNGLPA
ncbi:MAG: hypothetical protein Q9165_008802 [Trypethelium subeluteriae]